MITEKNKKDETALTVHFPGMYIFLKVFGYTNTPDCYLLAIIVHTLFIESKSLSGSCSSRRSISCESLASSAFFHLEGWGMDRMVQFARK